MPRSPTERQGSSPKEQNALFIKASSVGKCGKLSNGCKNEKKCKLPFLSLFSENVCLVQHKKVQFESIS